MQDKLFLSVFIGAPSVANSLLDGPRGDFYLRRDGIAFWLKTQDGTLFHHSANTLHRLFKLQPDTWYVVDVVFHVQAGTYDLRIVTPRASAPLVLLEQQPNAINTPGSQLAKISFIGDLEDRSSVHYFVDDVELRVLSTPLRLGGPTRLAGTASTTIGPTASRATAAPREKGQRDFILSGAPSSPRRTYFDEYLELKQLEASLPQCLPATTLRDFSVTRAALTDNAVLPNEIRFAFFIKDVSNLDDTGTSKIMRVGLRWFPQNYYPPTERPTDYKEFRKALGGSGE